MCIAIIQWTLFNFNQPWLRATKIRPPQNESILWNEQNSSLYLFFFGTKILLFKHILPNFINKNTYLSKVDGQINFIVFHSSGQRRTLPPIRFAIDGILWRMHTIVSSRVTIITNLKFAKTIRNLTFNLMRNNV